MRDDKSLFFVKVVDFLSGKLLVTIHVDHRDEFSCQLFRIVLFLKALSHDYFSKKLSNLIQTEFSIPTCIIFVKVVCHKILDVLF